MDSTALPPLRERHPCSLPHVFPYLAYKTAMAGNEYIGNRMQNRLGWFELALGVFSECGE